MSVGYIVRPLTKIFQTGETKMKWIATDSQTGAMRAQEVLRRAGISSQKKKLTRAGEGCAYAVGVSDFTHDRAKKLIEGAGIRIRETTDVSP